VMLGGVIATHWGWQAAFGVVGVPGLALALLYSKVRDYRTVALTARLDSATRSTGSAARAVVQALTRAPTMLWVCIGGSAQLIVLSAVWAWLPSYLNRVRGMPPDRAAVSAALVVLCGAVGSVVWGIVVDRAGRSRPRGKLYAMALLCLASMVVLCLAFGASRLGFALAAGPEFLLICAGAMLMTCTVGPVVAVVIDVIHPGIRATGASVLALFQNLFGLAAGPFIAGILSDAWSLPVALTVIPLFSLLAAGAFLVAARSYEFDMARVGDLLRQEEAAMPQVAAASS